MEQHGRKHGSRPTSCRDNPETVGRGVLQGKRHRFRSLAARCNNLAVDRIDLQFACKEVCRRMSGPCDDDWNMLYKMVAYMKHHPRMVVNFHFQESPLNIQVYVDTDYAGCRRSANGGFAMLGGSILKAGQLHEQW